MNEVNADNIVLWLCRLFGVMNLPIAFIAVIDLSSAVLMRAIPHTSEQWTGFLTAIAVLAGAVAGLTIRSSHSPNRKILHLLIAAFGLILTFVSLVRLVRTILVDI
jgi:energy-converting hydrogenase Eha subunit E